MRKILTILLVLMLALSMAACGNNDPAPPPPPPSDENGEVVDTGETFVITAAHSHQLGMSVHYFFVYFQEEIERLSNGRIEMNIFPAGQLGGDADLTTAVQAGDVTMMGANINPHSMFMPDLAIFDIQFVHESLEGARRVISDPALLARIAQIYAADGFHHLGFTDSSFRYITANFPIHTPADMQGLTIRSSANNFHVANWQAIGANPTPLPIGEVYISLQQGVVDAQDNPIEHNLLFVFYEQQTHFMESNHFFHVNTYIMCPVFYNSLPADLQAAVDQAAATAVQRTQAHHDANMQAQIDYLKDNGITFIQLTPDEMAQFAALVGPAWELIEEAVSAETFRIFFEAVERAR